jgi:hypothetical protein
LLIMKDLRNALRDGRNVGVLATAIWPNLYRIVAIPRFYVSHATNTITFFS